MHYAIRLLPVLLLVGLSSGQTAVQTSVCELAQQSKKFAQTTVRIRATVQTDFIEHTMIVDRNCPKIAASLWIPHELDNTKGVEQLRAVLRRQWMDSTSKIPGVDAEMTGDFIVEGKRRYFRVRSIDSVTPVLTTDR